MKKLPGKFNFLDATNKLFEFEKFEPFLDFIRTEQEFWSKKSEELGVKNTYLTIGTSIQSIIDTAKSWKKEAKNWDDATLSAHFQNLNSSVNTLLGANWVWSGHPFISAWLNAYKVSHTTGEGFIQLTLSKTIPNISSYEWFRGYLLAYEFELQDASLIKKRSDSEIESFEHISNTLSTAKNNLVLEIDQLKEDAENIKKTLTDFMRLEGPAIYWKERAVECKKQGDMWAGWLNTLIIVALFTFGSLLIAWLNKSTTKLNFDSLEGVSIVAITLSLFIFGIRTLSKLTFSAYHLQRDAEEREQLTHLYLALAKDGNVDADSRNIILQALFSRSESGLLSNEHGPTLPVQDAMRLFNPQKPS